MKVKKVKKRGSKDAQEAIRMKIVEYLRKKLGTQKQCAEVFGIAERSVNRIPSANPIIAVKLRRYSFAVAASVACPLECC